MATYTLTVTTGPAEEKALDMALAKVNTVRARNLPPRANVTKQQYLQGLVDDLVVDHKRRYKDDFRARVDAAMNTTASNAQISQVAQILGVDE